jgi:putative transposase
MSTTFTHILLHLIFSTKHRAPTITADIQKPLYEYLGGILRNEDCALLAIGGMPDHVHLLVRLPAGCTLTTLMRVLKANSSRWVNERSPNRGEPFYWQTGYGAFSVSQSQTATVRRYIERQEEHHARVSFREELIALLRRHKIDFDERYLLD